MKVKVDDIAIKKDVSQYITNVIEQSEGITDKAELNQIASKELGDLLVRSIKSLKITFEVGEIDVSGTGYNGITVLSQNLSELDL